MPLIVATYVSACSQRAAVAHCSDHFKFKKNAYYIKSLWVNIPNGIFIVNHACKIIHKALKTSVLYYFCREDSQNIHSQQWPELSMWGPQPLRVGVCFFACFLYLFDVFSFGRNLLFNLLKWFSSNILITFSYQTIKW
jgi:hypothetical protein